MLHSVPKPAQTQRLDRALLVTAIADGALTPTYTKLSHLWMPPQIRTAVGPAPPPENAS